MDHDQLFKELLRACFVDFIELFLPAVRDYLDVSSIEFIEQESHSEITARQKRSVDVLVKARFRGRMTCFLIHVEVQAQKQGWSSKRMFFYSTTQMHKHDLPVYPIALLSWETPKKSDSGRYIVEFPDRRVIEFHYAVIQLNRFDWRKYLKTENPAAIALMAKMGVEPKDRAKVRAACIRLLVGLDLPEKKLQPIMRFVDAYLPLTPQQKEEFDREIERLAPEQRSIAMEYMTSWERTGYAKGIIEGEKKGLLEGKLELALKLLTYRLGELSAAMRKRVSQLTSSQLDDLGEALLDFQSKADLSKWLKENIANGSTGRAAK